MLGNKSRTSLRGTKRRRKTRVSGKSRHQTVHQNSVRGKKVLDRLLFIIAVFAVAGGIFLYYCGHQQLRAYRHRVQQLEEEIRVLKEKNREKQEEIEAWKKDSFSLEKIAREMGLIKEGEVVYNIREEQDNQ